MRYMMPIHHDEGSTMNTALWTAVDVVVAHDGSPVRPEARPTALVDGQTVHLPYRGSDGHVYEIVR